ncbi:hypothetical protein GMA3_54 [Gordonia phage GMA3]|uniref:Uncharacterized protein n=1 Tax=Gordonia phage GMA3 TaxID=1647284 RepID=A0A0K0NKK1_9CAUD|nr:hypothetical protein AU105_gp054 [Gordonia phage GMA3]AKL88231.1 hypothetical protein GMA3_54 [Gordonia phage GMA3]
MANAEEVENALQELRAAAEEYLESQNALQAAFDEIERQVNLIEEYIAPLVALENIDMSDGVSSDWLFENEDEDNPSTLITREVIGIVGEVINAFCEAFSVKIVSKPRKGTRK